MFNFSFLSSRISRLSIWGLLAAIFILFGILFKVSSQGDYAQTYPKGFRGGACTIQTENLTVGYSSYYLPDQYSTAGDTIRTPYMAMQCGKIPGPGTLNIAIDLLYPEFARDYFLTMRLVKIEEDGSEEELERKPAQQNLSGVMTHTFRLDEFGNYRVYLEGQTEQDQVKVEIPIQVGQEWFDRLRQFLKSFVNEGEQN